MFFELHLDQRGLKMRKLFMGQNVSDPPKPLDKYVKVEPPPEPEAQPEP